MKKIVVILILLTFSVRGFPQENFSANQLVYDHGLLSTDKPFFGNQNGALLPFIQHYQVAANWNFQTPGYLSVSIVGPLHLAAGVGISWERMQNSQILRDSQSFTQNEQSENVLILLLGHRLPRGGNLGHQMQIQNFRDKKVVLWNSPLLPADENQNTELDRLHFTYRMDWHFRLNSSLAFSLLSANLFEFTFLEERQARFNIKTDKKVNFFQGKSLRANLPTVAGELALTRSVQSAIILGQQEEQFFSHLGIRVQLREFVQLAGGWSYLPATGHTFLAGIGSSWRHFHGFGSYDFREHNFQLALSYSPQPVRAIVQLEDLTQHYQEVFTCKLPFYYRNPFVSGKIRNLTGRPVSVKIQLEGKSIRTHNQQQVLEAGGTYKFQFPLPELKSFEKLQVAGCQLQVTAFQQDKQILEQTLCYQLHEKHSWNGELADLPWFVQIAHPEIDRVANFIKSRLKKTLAPENLARAAFEYLGEKLKYLPDPTPGLTDYVIYPTELVERKAGDCEDLSVFFCSVLGALGVETSLVEICEANRQHGHIFVLVNTKLIPDQINGQQINYMRYVFRQNRQGKETAWLPVELTGPGETFEQACQKGAELYYEKAIKAGGLARGTVQIVDIF